MAVKKNRKRWRTGRLHWPGSRREHEENMAAKLTPLEETDAFKQSPQKDGNRGGPDDTIRVDSASVRVPDNLVDDERSASSTFRFEPVVIVILIVALAWVAFIAWQIARMPLK
jgi:hypothetical protein